MLPSLCSLVFFFNFIFMCNFLYLLLAVLVFAAAQVFLQLQSGALSRARASAVAAPPGSGVQTQEVRHGLGCSTACGIFPDQASSPRLLHRWAGSLSVSQQGSPCLVPKLACLSSLEEASWRTETFFFSCQMLAHVLPKNLSLTPWTLLMVSLSDQKP